MVAHPDINPVQQDSQDRREPVFTFRDSRATKTHGKVKLLFIIDLSTSNASLALSCSPLIDKYNLNKN